MAKFSQDYLQLFDGGVLIFYSANNEELARLVHEKDGSDVALTFDKNDLPGKIMQPDSERFRWIIKSGNFEGKKTSVFARVYSPQDERFYIQYSVVNSHDPGDIRLPTNVFTSGYETVVNFK